MLVDYHVHAAAHGEYTYSLEWLNKFIDQAVKRNIKEIGFSEHDEFSNLIDLDILNKTQSDRKNDISIRLGLEMDYIPGREEKIRELIRNRKYDYIIGSVHYIDGWGFDHPDYKDGFIERDIDEIYHQYAGILIQMVQSGCFDVVGHFDLVKIWGHRPRKQKSLYYFEPVLKAIKKYNLVVEINSAGLRKEVSEIYPAFDLIERMYNYNIPITFGSDAHLPEQMGEGLNKAYQSAWKAGYRYLTKLSQREKIVAPL